MENRASQLRALLSAERIVVAPGVNECVSARIVEQLGFKAVYMTGLGTEAAILGKPDIGLASMAEVVGNARNIADSVSIPLISDADTGYGNALNVWRTVREFAKANVAAIHLEDQVTPKKCGGLPGRVVVPIAEMVGKIRAAKDAAGDDLVIIARSDAKYLGVEEVIQRLNSYLEAGADLAMEAEPYTIEELRHLAREVKPLCICAGNPREEACLPVKEYADMGVKLLLYPIVSLMIAARAVQDAYTRLRDTGHLSGDFLKKHAMSFREFLDLIGFPEWSLRGDKYGPA